MVGRELAYGRSGDGRDCCRTNLSLRTYRPCLNVGIRPGYSVPTIVSHIAKTVLLFFTAHYCNVATL